MPPTQEGFQYYMVGAPLAGGNTATVLTALEVEKMFKALQKQIASLEKQVAKLKAQKSGR